MKKIGYDSCTSWLVAACCSVISCLSVTPYRITGLIFVLIIENYDTDRTTASIPIVLFIIIRCFGGPVFGVLGEKFGEELVTVAGCLLIVAGFGTCFYAQNIIGLILLLGVVYGVGLACSDSFLPYILKKHFTDNIFNTAHGTIRAGPCLGAILIPPAATYLIESYGVSGAILILSGIMLHTLPVGIFILSAGKMQDIIIRRQIHEDKRFKNEENALCSVQNIGHEQQINIDSIAVDKNSENIRHSIDKEHFNNEDLKVASVSFSSLPQNHAELEKNTSEFNIKLELVTKDEVEPEFLTSRKRDNPSLSDIHIKPVTEKTEKVKNASNTSSNLRLEKTSKDKGKNILNSFKVFKNISFLITLLNIGLATYVTTLFWTTMIDYSRDKGISRNLEIYFLMLHPLIDLVGRTCFGWLTDRGYLTLSNFAMLCYVQMALSMFLVMWTNHFWAMMVGTCWYALTSGAVGTIYPGIIFKCVDRDHQTMAIASRFAIYGVLVFTSSPLIGYFRENLGSYDGLYCLFIVICIVCAAVIPLMFKFSKSARTTVPNKS